MFALHVLAFIPLLFGFPDLTVNWSGGELSAVRIVADGKEEVISQCIQSGLEVRYRYELRLCKRRLLWADFCTDESVQTRTMQFDPISESYRVVVDKIGDREPAKITTFPTLDGALRAVNSLTSPSLDQLGFNEKDFPSSRLPYLGVRVVTDCKGDYNETIARISSFITLGLIDIGTFDSGWVDFALSK